MPTISGDSQINLGSIGEFGVIQFEARWLSDLLITFINQGSKVHTVAVEDLTVFADPLVEWKGKKYDSTFTVGGKKCANTLEGLMEVGAKFFDAIFWLGMPESDRPDPVPFPANKQGKISDNVVICNDSARLAKYLFVYYFYLLTRAKGPTHDEVDDSLPVPNFLRTILGVTQKQSEIAKYLASFPLNNIDPSWIKHVPHTGLSQESLSRFGLGVAGYRMISPFKLYEPFHDTPIGKIWHVENEKALTAGTETDGRLRADAIAVAKSFATVPADWDIHPSTRNPNILGKYGNLNKNFGNLMLEVFSDEQLDEMVATKALFQKPKYDALHTQYKTWTLLDTFKGGNPIFRRA